MYKSKYIYFLLGLLAAVCFSGLFISTSVNRSFVADVEWVEHTYQVLYKAEQVKSAIFSVNINRRVYLSERTPAALRAVDSAVVLAFNHADSLAALTADNASQQPRIAALKKYGRQRVALFQQLISGANPQLAKEFVDSNPVPKIMQQLIEEIKQEELRLLVLRKNQSRRTNRYFETAFWGLMVTALVLLLLAALVAWYSQRLEKKLRHSVQEITQLNKNLEQSEKKFRGLIEHGSDLIVLANRHLQLLYYAPSLPRSLGYQVTELANKNLVDLIHPHDRIAVTEAVKITLEQNNKTAPLTFRLQHTKGNYLWLEGTLSNLLAEEAVEGLLLNVQNITRRVLAEEELRRSEKIYRDIATGIPRTIISIIDGDRRYKMIEGDLLDQVSFASRDWAGKPVSEVLSLQQRDQISPLLNRVFAGENLDFYTTQEGLYLLTRFVPLRDDAGDVFAAMTITLDITELKQAKEHMEELAARLEEKVQERTQQLEAANKEMEAFSYSVSHDLRAPLRAVSGYANILGEDYQEKLDAEGQRILKKIQSSAAQMGTLIDDLLSFARVGKKEVSLARLNMEHLVNEVLRELPTAENKPAKIILQQPLPPATGDHTAIRQVLANLISNAIKYSSQKPEPVIEIKGVEEKERTVYSVTDNGVGFDMRYAHKLFGVFQRLHSSHEFPGTGVGLAIVQRIIHKHNGQVWAESEVGKGTTFYFSLPNKNA